MLKLGIIGRNFVVDRLLAAAEQVPDLQLTAIYSRSMADAEAFAQTHGLPYFFDKLEELAACPEVEAVYVASPNFCHFTQCKLILEHGKHVLCEKPGVTNSTQLEILLETATAHNVVYLEAMRLIHDDALDVIRTALPQVGTLRRVTFELTQYSSRYDRFRAGEPDINAFNPQLSNGSLMDLGCYCVHAIVALFGRPERVHGICSRLDNGFDSNGIVLMQYPGFVAEAVYSKVSKQVAPTTLMGEDGSILIDNVDHIKRIWLQPRKGEAQELPYEEKRPNNLMYELRHFCDMAAGKSDPAPWNELSRITQAVMDKARSDMGIRFPEEMEDDVELRSGYSQPEVVRALFGEYTDTLHASDPTISQYLDQQNYDDELLHLEKKYGLPRGRLYVAWMDGQAAGCVALRPIDEDACEMKRLYVRPPFRGRKLERIMAQKIIADAREIGYSHILLDTLEFLPHAVALYRELGFYEIDRYNDSPMDNSIYMRLDLN